MRIALYQGFDFAESGSSPCSQHLALALVERGHRVHVLCRESDPERLAGVQSAWTYDKDGQGELLFEREESPACGLMLHSLPASQGPSSTTGEGDPELSKIDSETTLLEAILRRHPVEVLVVADVLSHARAARRTCERLGIPYILWTDSSTWEQALPQGEALAKGVSECLMSAARLLFESKEVEGLVLDNHPECSRSYDTKSRLLRPGVDTDSLVDLEPNLRGDSIGYLFDAAPFEGKPPQLTRQLQQRLSKGEFEAVQEFRGTYDMSQPDAQLERRLAQMDLTQPTILFAGPLTVGSGLQSLIMAMPRVLEVLPKAQLIVVGSGSYREVIEGLIYSISSANPGVLEHLVDWGFDLDEGSESGHWVDVAKFLEDPVSNKRVMSAGPRLASRVQFFGDLPEDLMRRVLPCADVAVFPTVASACSPRSLMQSMSCGVFPLVTDIGALRAEIDALKGSLPKTLLDRMRIPAEPEGRIEALAEQLIAALTDDMWAEVKPRLRRLAVERYDWKVRASELEEILGEVVRQAAASPSAS